jgi:hypothetical protein
MPAGCLSGVATAAANLAPVHGEFDGAAFGLATFMGTRVNNVSQGFDRRLGGIDYKIKRQKLHREDIRDLIELTTQRMDIYQLVGTLLLTFCMTWYTDASIWQLPVWYSDLWLISNFAAIGYLLLGVWLAMYASVAARSTGTRLLTSYARIAFPRKDELDAIKYPVFFKNPFKRVPRTESADEECTSSPEEFMLSEDDTQHFCRFLDELPQWLAHDTWSRVCMSYGLNQMLQALSFFSMGNLWPKSPMVAILSYAAIKRLSIFVLWLDIGELEHSWWDKFALISFKLIPSVLAVFMLLYDFWIGPLGKGLMVVVVFLSHAGWLWYLSTLFKFAGSKDGRFQPGNYANVLEWLRSDQVGEAGTNDDSGMEYPCIDDDGRGSSSSDMKAAVDPDASTDKAAGAESVVDAGRLPQREAMNGGRAPGYWQAPKAKKPQKSMSPVHSDIWLPVTVIKYFTGTTVAWWIVAGILHGLIIELDRHNRYKHLTGDDTKAPLTPQLFRWALDDYADVKPSLSPQLVQWPEPARLFKVNTLLCDDTHIWVSSQFSLFAFADVSNQAKKNLNFVKDGDVSALICGNSGCDALISPSPEHGWLLSSLDPDSESAALVPIPASWRLVAGSWLECIGIKDMSSCSVAGLVGWDGTNVFAATLEKGRSSGNWTVHKRFQVDPVVGFCGGQLNGAALASCGERAKNRYQDVRALQLSAGGDTLLVLSNSDGIDVWDLPGGTVRETIHIGDEEGFTSMCLAQGKIFLSREESEGPAIYSMGLSSNQSTLLQQPKSSRLAELMQRSRSWVNRSSVDLTKAAAKQQPIKQAVALLSGQEVAPTAAVAAMRSKRNLRSHLLQGQSLQPSRN